MFPTLVWVLWLYSIRWHDKNMTKTDSGLRLGNNQSAQRLILILIAELKKLVKTTATTISNTIKNAIITIRAKDV